MKKILFTTLISILIFTNVFAQVRKADRLYADWNDAQAAELYEKAIQKEPTPELYYKLGRCYQNIKLYEKALNNYDKVNQAGQYPDAEFYLNYGLILKNAEKYAQAKEAFKTYNKLNPSDKRGKFFMNSCDVVIEDHKWDEPVSITNVGALNTKDADFSPVTYKDGMVFTSDRYSEDHEKIYGKTGGYYLNIFYVKNGGSCTDFSKAVLLRDCSGFNEPAPLQGKDINLAYHNGPVSFSKNYDTVFISRVKKDLTGDAKTTLGIERNKIFYTRMVNGKWTDIEPFYLNSDSFSVALPLITKDGQKLYFASDMPGGYGESDIYYCNREGSSWSKPINMGPMVNTFGREKFPYVDQDGNFFFSSDGYMGFGGLDICVAENVNGKLTQAKVMKSPVNSSKDDYGVIVLTGKTGYISSNRTGGLGRDDIFYFDMGVNNDVFNKIYTIGYRPLPEDSARLNITFIDSKSRQQLGKGRFYATNSKTKKTVDLPLKDGSIKIAVKERSKSNFRTYAEGYNMQFDTFYIGSLKNDTSINLTIVLTKPKNMIALRSDNIHPAFFDLDKSNIRVDAKDILDSVIMYMNANPDVHVNIGAHTDVRGTEKHNMILSKHRAESTVKYLKSKGIVSKRIKWEAFGYSQIINQCSKDVKCSEAEHQQNRRVEFKFDSDTQNAAMAH
ncbi:MAG: OmpA family protein [Bacteroidia bacterium]|nr:OmpA family protein [Bacteroidia bacterium]